MDIDHYTNGLFNLQSNDGLKFMENNFALFIDELKVWKGCEIYVAKFESLHANFMQKGLNIYTKNYPGTGYNVLNHGDFHPSNMLFKRENGRLVDVLFVKAFWNLDCYLVRNFVFISDRFSTEHFCNSGHRHFLFAVHDCIE
jgi:hypothetical protein